MERVSISEFKSLVSGFKKEYPNRYAPSKAIKSKDLVKVIFQIENDERIVIFYDENGNRWSCGHLIKDDSEEAVLYPTHLTSNKVKEVLDKYKGHIIEARLTSIIAKANIPVLYEIVFSVY